MQRSSSSSCIDVRRAWLLLAVLLGTATTPLGALELALGNARFMVPSTSLKEIRFRHTVRQQFDFSCGSAAVATLLTYHYGHPVQELQVFEHMYRHGDQQKIRRQGFSMLDMQRYLAARGFRADGFHLPLQKLLDARLPAIVLLSDKGYQHFVVVKGMRDGRVLLGDPSSGTRAMSRAAFESAWVGKLLFVVHGFNGRAGFNVAADWRAAPSAPLADVIVRDGIGGMALPKLGPGNF